MKEHEDKYMTEHNDREIRDALKQSCPPVNTELRRDLWRMFCANSTFGRFVCLGMTGPWLA
jgi:hypothetical protein